jgi:hypothetical protein
VLAEVDVSVAEDGALLAVVLAFGFCFAGLLARSQQRKYKFEN